MILIALLLQLAAGIPGPVIVQRPAAPAVYAPVLLSRIDQTSRRFVIRNLRAGEPLEVYVDGRLFDAEIARGYAQMISLRTPLRAGSLVAVVAGRNGRSAMRRSTTIVQNDYLQFHYDLGKTGWNNAETVLTTANVRPSMFGHLFTLPVDGFVLAQPLYVANVTIGPAAHNVTIVATEADSVYAFDADTGALLWQQSYANPATGANPIPYQVVRAMNIAPVIGITSTPAIDADANTIYFVAAIQQTVSQGFEYHQFLHAVDLTTGLDRPGSPVDMTATAYLNNNTPVPFDALHNLNRASMLLANGSVYVSFGSHNDAPGSKPHGWIFRYDASTLSLQSFFNTSLDKATDYRAGIWAAGWGPGTDADGNVYYVTGDGPFDGFTGGHNWGQTVMKMTPGLTLSDYFTPADIVTQGNRDLGAGGVLLMPDQPGLFPHLATIAGHEGTIYLLNRDMMGEYTPGGPDAVLQELQSAIGSLRGGPAYYSGPAGTFVYYCGSGNPLESYALTTAPSPQLALVSSSRAKCGQTGTIPVVSSNGMTAGTAIVWMTTRPKDLSTTPVALYAFDATNLQRRLISIPVCFWQNLNSRPFQVPTVINGRVYVATSNGVEVYGLFSARTQLRARTSH